MAYWRLEEMVPPVLHNAAGERFHATAEPGTALFLPGADGRHGFHPPQPPATLIIMVCAGTGIAPFRGFVQEREATGATGKNWLFFGGRSLYHDFLYQLEWQQALRRKSLHRVDVAFSRDQAEKIYVQHRIKQAGKELFA